MLFLDRNGDGVLDRRELLMQLARLARGPDTTRMALRMLAWLLRARSESSTDDE